jgi:hypothetical protein
MAGASLKGTMSGTEVVGPNPPTDPYADMPPEVRAAAQKLLSISSAPTQADVDAAHQLAAAAYAPVMQQIQNQPAPSPQTVDQADPLHTFAALLAANLAGSVNPAAATPTYNKLASQREEAQGVAKENRTAQRDFLKNQSEQSLQVASQITSDALKQAADAGDDKAATQKALQLARINDALERRRNAENDARTLAREKAIAKIKADANAEVDPEIFDPGFTTTDFGTFINKDAYPAKLQIPLIKAAKDRGAKIVDKTTAKQMEDLNTAWMNLQYEASEVMPKLSNSTNWMDRAKTAKDNLLARATGSDPIIAGFGSTWTNALKLLRATGPSTGLRINKSEIDRSLKYDQPDVIWDTQPILQQKLRNLQTLISNGQNSAFSTDWRSIATKNGKVNVLAPDGTTSQVTPAAAEELVTKKGYARIFSNAQLPKGTKTSTAGAEPTATHRFNPATGKVEAIQ